LCLSWVSVLLIISIGIDAGVKLIVVERSGV
jgi:hypothetical protein